MRKSWTSMLILMLANTTRLTNSLLESAKPLRAKNGDTRIPVEAEAYRLTMIQDLAVSPYTKGLFDGKGAAGVEGGWEWVMIDDQKVTPEYDLVSFNWKGFQWGGPLVFAGYDAAKDVIVVGRL